jgi:hypothetical protein
MLEETLGGVSKNIDHDPALAAAARKTSSAEYPEFILENFRPETRLLLFCLAGRRGSEIDRQIEKLLHSELDWDKLTGAAVRHALLPLFFRTLDEFSEEIPPEILQNLKGLNATNGLRNMYMTGELFKLADLLAEHGIKALPHKGPVLAAQIYGDVALRQFCDLDILVGKKDVLQVKRLFQTAGYIPVDKRTAQQDRYYIDSGRPYNYKFVSENGQVEVELHWKFTSKYNSFPVDYARIMDDLTGVGIAGRTVPALRPEHLLVILCQHGSKHFWTRLLWIADIAALVDRHSGLDWDRTMRFARRHGAERMLLLGLELARKLLDAEPPAGVSARIESDRTVGKLADRIISQLAGAPERPIEDFEAHLFSCRMRERWSDRARYTAYHLLPRLPRFRRFTSLIKRKNDI